MTPPPATPDNSVTSGTKSSAKLALPVVDKTATSKVLQASANEPSPASTYGASAAGDSVPVTPQEINGKCSIVFDDSFRFCSSMVHFLLRLDFITIRFGEVKIVVEIFATAHPVLLKWFHCQVRRKVIKRCSETTVLTVFV